MNTKSDYIKKHSEWFKKLDKCEFVGEIYLAVEELQELANNVMNIDCIEEKHDLLVIIAVNCAYHFYDDEGFWKHFLNLLGMSNNIANRELYGSIMETRLKKRGLLKRERQGPFRYVGSILEQCAVSKKYIYSFAGAIKELRNRYGWKGVFSIDYQQYLYFIRDLYCSRYLKSFLADPEGWEFTKQVAHLCELYDSGTLSQNDLESLSGFQPDFWKEFLAVLGTSSTNAIRTKFTPLDKPFLFFNPDRMTIGLNLSSSVRIDYPSTTWIAPITWLDQKVLFSSLYYGRYTLDDGRIVKWERKGWIPDGAPALFNINWVHVHNENIITPGTYYLIASSLDNISCDVIETLGIVNLIGDMIYKAFLITINDNTMLPGYKIKEKNEKSFALTWETDGTIYRFPYSVNSFPVFCERIPRILVSDFSLISNNTVGLFYDYGNGPHMIKTIQPLDVFYNEVKQKAPVKGRIWLEVISRSRYIPLDAIMPELNFALVSDCQIIIEPELVSCWEMPVLTVSTNRDCKIYMDDCIPLDENSTKWSVLCKSNKVNGKLSYKNIDVILEIPIYRTRLYYENGRFIDCICPDDVDFEEIFIVTGLPGMPVMIGLLGSKRVLEVGNFNEKGQCLFSSNIIKKLVQNYSDPITEITIIYEGCSYRTGAVYIDVNQIKKVNINGEWPIKSSISNAPVELLKNCSKICCSPVETFRTNRIPEMSDCISEWVYTVFSCASVFDSTQFYVGEKLLDPLSLLPESELKTLLLSLIENKNATISQNNYFNIGCVPKVDRWLRKMEQYSERYSVNGRIKMIREWSIDITEKNPPYRNTISCLAGGQILSSAWHSYFKGKVENVPRQINTINSDSDIVNDLKEILESIVMLRFARFERASLLLERKASLNEVESVRKVLQNMVFIVQGKKDLNQLISQEFNSIMLPLIDIDQNLIRHVALLAKNTEEAKVYARKCEDWLFILVLVMFLDNDDDRLRLAEHLLDIQSLIPLSPQRNDIIKKLTNITREERQWKP